MLIVGLRILRAFQQKHPQARASVESWRYVVERATWLTPQDIKAQYPSADYLSGNRVIFNISGNKYRLLVTILYQSESIQILRIGTHAEYDRWDLEE